jgi:uncharacterized membrane protein
MVPSNLNNKGFSMQFNIAPESFILLAAGISLLFFPRLLRFSAAVFLSMAEYFRADTKDKKTVNVPVWAGAGAILIGGALLVFGGRKA